MKSNWKRRQPCPSTRLCVTVVGVVLSLLSARIASGQTSAITCGVPGSTAISPPCTDSWVSTVGFLFVTGDAEPAPTSITASGFQATASALTSFNSNRLTLTSPNNTGPRGESRFLDTFRVTGGSGTGTLTFYWSAVGTLQQFAPPALCDPFRDGVDYGLDALSATAATGLATTTLPLCAADTRTINRSGSFTVTFTYDVPFVEGLLLSGDAPNGFVDLTSQFTAIALPPGATLLSGSGTTYPTTTPSPIALLASLSNLVQTLNLSNGISNSLDAKLANALQALDAARSGDVVSACNRLDAFVNEVAAQAGKALTQVQANQLTAAAQAVEAALPCR